METNWTKAEFKAYLLSYAAQSNYFESPEESAIIRETVSNEAYYKIHRELDKDNDYQSIQKILFNLEKFGYSKDQLEELITEIQALFWADGSFDLLESNFLTSIKRLVQ